jgi:hypothetical protein
MKIFKELKKLGYIHYSDTTIEELDDLPLNSDERISEQALVLRWFREKYKLNSEVNYLPNVEKYGIITSDMAGMKPKDLSKKENFERGKKVTNNFVKYDTYEEAELACLTKLIDIVIL